MGVQPATANRIALVEAYRRGDPLSGIAKDFGTTVSRLCDTLIVETVQDDELERSKCVRRRGRGTMGTIWDNVGMISRLDGSGISRSEIPVVLRALGKEIDAEVAVELLHIPGIPGEDPTISQEPLRLSDKLSLLFVIGKHYGIEPDYQLALGQMPENEVRELRLLCSAKFPPRRFAEILAVAETTKLAIRARVATSLSVEEYANTAEPLSRLFRGYIFDDAASWPTPAPVLARRLGEGSWDQALRTVGLSVRTAADRLAEDDFLRALRDFTEECRSFGFPLSLEIYDRWVTAEVALGGERPSALELIDRYGSWDAGLREVLEPESAPGRKPPAKSIPDLDVEPLFEPADPAHEAAWVRAGEYLCELLARIPRRRSLLIEYAEAGTGTFRPYARGGRTAEGIWCEISPEQFPASEAYPINPDDLHYEDWNEPDDDSSYWRKQEMPFHDSGHQILDALRYGWQCLDPWQLRWSTRQPISGQGRNNGVTIEDALAGDVQSLRNAG